MPCGDRVALYHHITYTYTGIGRKHFSAVNKASVMYGPASNPNLKRLQLSLQVIRIGKLRRFNEKWSIFNHCRVIPYIMLLPNLNSILSTFCMEPKSMMQEWMDGRMDKAIPIATSLPEENLQLIFLFILHESEQRIDKKHQSPLPKLTDVTDKQSNEFWGPFYLHDLTLIPVWIRNHILL